ncbi:Abrin-a [Orbilia brochopaga]|nr:Abrin-a [Drechslerella brochopaga]
MRYSNYVALLAGVAASLVRAGRGPPPPAPAKPSIDFTESFDISSSSGDNYKTFIETLRSKAVSTDTWDGVPVLPPQAKGTPTKFFDVTLKTTDGGTAYDLTLRFQRDNLYVLGHKPMQGAWQELKSDPERAHWIPDIGKSENEKTVWTPFTENYGGLESYAKAKRAQTEVGQQALRRATKALAITGTSGQDQARAYLVMAQMLSESMRLKDISAHVAQNWDTGKSLPQQLVDLENAWKSMSTTLDPTPGDKKKAPSKESKEEAMKKLAVVLRPSDKSDGPSESGPGKKRPGKVCKRISGCNIPGDPTPDGELPSAPKKGISKAAVLEHFGSITLNLAWMASSCMAHKAVAHKPDEQPRQPESIWQKVAHLAEVPGLLASSFMKLFSHENVEAFEKSAGDLTRAFSEVPSAVKSGLNDLRSTENLDAFKKSLGDLKKAVKEVPALVENRTKDLISAQNFEAFEKSLNALGKAVIEVPGAIGSGVDDLGKAIPEIGTAIGKAPQQLAQAAQDFANEYNKLVPVGSNGRKVLDSMLSSVPIPMSALRTYGQRIGASIEEITGAAAIACTPT